MKTKNQIVFLRGKITTLRPVEESDLPTITRWINDQEVTRFLKTRMPLMLAYEKKWFEGLPDRKDDITLVMTTSDGRPIGMMGVHRINWCDGTATTGAFIGEKSLWGKGYGTDAKMQLLNYCFNTLNLRKISSKVYAFNKRSIAYSLHCGYKEEGVLRQHVFREGEYHDVVILSLFKPDWLPYWKKYRGGKKA
jgi:RimJ/RimL family protein N-acetyltransferase